MSRLLSRALLASAVLTAVACADAVTAPNAGSNGQSPSPLSPSAGPSLETGGVAVGGVEEYGDREIFDIRDEHVDYDERSTPTGQAALGAAATSTGISYHGGPVLQAGTKVVAIYWSASTIYAGGPTPGTTGAGTGDGSNVGYFLRNLGGSPYFNINSTYTDAAGRAIVNSVQYTRYWANNTSAPAGTTRVTDAQMASMLSSGFSSGKITYVESTIYLIFTYGRVNLGGGFGTQYCAYHSYVTMSIGGVSRTVIYAAMPYDYAYAGGCTNGTKSPNNDPAADAEVSVLAHEIEEATTDYRLNAWYDSRGYENADKCAWTFGTTYTTANGGVANMRLGAKDFLVQRNWLNRPGGGCALRYP